MNDIKKMFQFHSIPEPEAIVFESLGEDLRHVTGDLYEDFKQYFLDNPSKVI